nr:hypothetical protein [Kosmotoga olearia]
MFIQESLLNISENQLLFSASYYDEAKLYDSEGIEVDHYSY